MICSSEIGPTTMQILKEQITITITLGIIKIS